MRKYFLILSILVCSPLWGTSYYMRADGTAATAAAATGPCGTVANTMNMTVHNAATFAADDVIYLCDNGGVYRAELDPPSAGSSAAHPITYTKGQTAQPVINGSDIALTWTLVDTNTWQGNFSPTPSQVLFDNARKTLVASQAAVTASGVPGTWYSSSGHVWVYSTADPSTVWTNPGVEVGQRYPIHIVSKNYVKVDGLHLTKSNNDGIRVETSNGFVLTNSLVDWNRVSGITTVTCDSATITANNSSNNGTILPQHHGVYLETTTNSTISGNYFSNDPGFGVQIQDSSNNNIVTGNTSIGDAGMMTIYDAGGGFPLGNIVAYNIDSGATYMSIDIGGSAATGTNKIYNNSVAALASGANGVYINAVVTPGELKNNILYSTGTVALWRMNGTTIATSDYNLIGPERSNYIYYHGVNKSTLATYVSASGLDSHSVMGDPSWLNAGAYDFHLKPTSSVLVSGTGVNLTSDFYGNTVIPGFVSLGAVQYQPRPAFGGVL